MDHMQTKKSTSNLEVDPLSNTAAMHKIKKMETLKFGYLIPIPGPDVGKCWPLSPYKK